MYTAITIISILFIIFILGNCWVFCLDIKNIHRRAYIFRVENAINSLCSGIRYVHYGHFQSAYWKFNMMNEWVELATKVESKI